MDVEKEPVIKIIIFFLAVIGFFVAKRIRDHKVKNAPLVCPVGFDCHAVVHSDYSKFLGFPVEVFGMIYYAAMAVLELLSLPYKLPFFLEIAITILSIAAFAFSFYLISIQTFVIKKGCSWCIVSAIICFVIFIFNIWM